MSSEVPTTEDIQAIAPNLTEGMETVELTYWLDYATTFCPEKWKDRRRNGIILLTLHCLTMHALQSAEIAGSINQISKGSRSSPSSAEDDYKLTFYGRQFLMIREALSVTTGFAATAY